MPRTVNNLFTTHGKDVLSSGAERVNFLYTVGYLESLWVVFFLGETRFYLVEPRVQYEPVWLPQAESCPG